MLIFNLKKEWFNKIKNGKKTHEYRLQTKYWIKRLSGVLINQKIAKEFCICTEIGETYITQGKYYKDGGLIKFACGYPKRTEKEKWLTAKIINISTNIDGRETDLEIDEPVFDIEFKLVKLEE